jgi:hypothetical protein
MVLGALASALYAVLPSSAPGAAVLYCSAGTVSLLVTLIGVRRNRPERRAGWLLQRIGYRLAQGYHFGKPVTEPGFRAPMAVSG